MGCGCHKRGEYDNIRTLAKKFADDQKVVVAIFKKIDGTYGFIPVDCPEYENVLPTEYITPSQ